MGARTVGGCVGGRAGFLAGGIDRTLCSEGGAQARVVDGRPRLFLLAFSLSRRLRSSC